MCTHIYKYASSVVCISAAVRGVHGTSAGWLFWSGKPIAAPYVGGCGVLVCIKSFRQTEY